MWRIAIPSLGRIDGLGKKTLATLDRYNIDKSIIDIFCIKDEIDAYQKRYPGYNFVEAPLGLKEVRNFIFQEYYNEGDWVINLDDDLEGFRRKNPYDDQPSSYWDLDDLNEEFRRGFEECIENGYNLWGIYPVDNHMFMKNTITYDLKFCGGWCWGCIVRKPLQLIECPNGDGDDYERTLKHYLHDGGVVRLNYFCAKTKYRQVGGGMDGQRLPRSEVCDYLVKTYPMLVSIRQKKNGPNPVLRDRR